MAPEGELAVRKGRCDLAEQGEAFFFLEAANEEDVECILRKIPALLLFGPFGNWCIGAVFIVDSDPGHEKFFGRKPGFRLEPFTDGVADKGQQGPFAYSIRCGS